MMMEGPKETQALHQLEIHQALVYLLVLLAALNFGRQTPRKGRRASNNNFSTSTTAALFFKAMHAITVKLSNQIQNSLHCLHLNSQSY